MNAIERITNVMMGEIPDRVPIMGNLLEQGAKELGLSIQDYYSNGEYVAEGQLRLRDKYGYDNLSGFFYAGLEAEMLGCRRIIFSEIGPPNVGHLIIRNFNDIEKLEIPENISQLPAFEELAKCIKLLKHEAAGKYPVGSAVISSFSLPAILMGIDKWMDMLINGPESLRHELLIKCSNFCIRLMNALKETGVDGVSYSNPVGSADFFSVEQFKKLALEWIVRDMKAVGPEGITYFNGGGRINPMIDTIIEHTQITTYYINPLDDTSEAKRIIGNRGVSSGVINDIRLMDWNKKEIYSEVKSIMNAGAKGGRFIFGTLVMPYLLPEENIHHLFNAAIEYGNYS
ncbi:MAG: uroporphyrinogen decarboxylase family protein [Pseudomonadota bacterium]